MPGDGILRPGPVDDHSDCQRRRNGRWLDFRNLSM